MLDEALFGPRPASRQGRLEGTPCRRPGEEPPVLLRLSSRQRLLHLRRPQGAVRHRQLPGRVRQAAQDDPEPRSSASGQLAQGKSVPATIDDSNTGDFVKVVTNVKNADPYHDARRGAEDLHAARGLRDQPVRLGGRVSRPGRPGLDDLRRQGPALGRHHAVVSRCICRVPSPTTRS